MNYVTQRTSSLKALLMTYNRDKGFGTANRGRYSNGKVDALTEDALQTVDDVKREAYLQRATEIAINDTGVIPLHFQVNLWAARDAVAGRIAAYDDFKSAKARTQFSPRIGLQFPLTQGSAVFFNFGRFAATATQVAALGAEQMGALGPDQIAAGSDDIDRDEVVQ